MPPSLYIETTVVSYLTSRDSRDVVTLAHQQITREWWGQCLVNFDAYISAVVIQEIERGDPAAAKQRLEAIQQFPILELTPEVDRLAEEYFSKLALPLRARADAEHLALAACHGMDYLATWNCTHIASSKIKRTVEEINARWNIRMPTLCTPEELMDTI